MENIERIIARVQKNNEKAMRKIPTKEKQICETCALSGRGCGYRSGRCATGIYQPKRG